MPSQANRLPDKSPSPRRRRPLLIVLSMLALLFVITYAGRLAEYRRLRNLEASMEQQFDDAEARGRKLADDLDQVKSPEYTEKIAITEIGVAPKGVTVLNPIDALAGTETILAPAGAPDQGTEALDAPNPTAPKATTPDADTPVWRLWFSVFKTDEE